MYGLKNKDLTELQKEFIENKNNKRKSRLKKMVKVLAWLGIITIGFVLSYFIGNMFFLSFCKEAGWIGYLVIFVALSLLIYLLLGLFYDVKDIIWNINTSRNYNKMDFAIRGFLTKKEYDIFVDLSCKPEESVNNVSEFFGYSTEPQNSAEDLIFSEYYNDLHIIISVLNKLIANDISSEKLRRAGKNLIANYLNNLDKIKVMFAELTECKNKNQYNFHCENYKVVADGN